MQKIKVFLSDPQVLFREGIHFTLSGEEEFEVTGKTTSNEEAFIYIEANPPNIAILSMIDSRLDGTEVTRRIKRHLPSVSVILTIDKSDEEQLFAAMKSGASACLTKDTEPAQLLDTIRAVARGSQPIIEALLNPGLALRALIEFEDLATLNEQLNNVLASLTFRETEVLHSIGDGSGIGQVAAELNIDEEAIKLILGLIVAKLVANNQAIAVIEATQRSLLAISSRALKTGEPATEYAAGGEFSRLKGSPMARLKSLVGKLTRHDVT
jgi:DNA-binding NarL/FixJ family response regulator